MSNVRELRPIRRCRYGYSKDEALIAIAEAVTESACVRPTQHAYERMEEREVTFAQVLRVLRRGAVSREANLGRNNTWEVTYRADCSGQDVSVAVTLDRDQMGNIVVVITVISH